jgi:hypothetical protein
VSPNHPVSCFSAATACQNVAFFVSQYEKVVNKRLSRRPARALFMPLL